MRLRRKPWIDEAILEFGDLVSPLGADPTVNKGRWQEVFYSSNPIHLEIGTGKGDFIRGMAEKNPNTNYIGIEMQQGVIYFAAKKLADAGLKNVRLLVFDASKLVELFAPGEIKRLYLNFSDPWPKARHAKRRLTSQTFLRRYQNILPASGEIHFKTDNRGLFDYSVEEFRALGARLTELTYDLHADAALMEDNVMTEYERRFSGYGAKICQLKAVL